MVTAPNSKAARRTRRKADWNLEASAPSRLAKARREVFAIEEIIVSVAFAAIHEILRSPLFTEVPSTTSLDRYSPLEDRWIGRRWCPILRPFRSKSDEIGVLRAVLVYQKPLKKDLSTGALVGNEVVLEEAFCELRLYGVLRR